MTRSQAINKARDVIRRQHKAISTEQTYLFWLRRYIAAIGQMPNELASERKLEWFLTELARRHDVSASTQNQAFNAILFFYKDVLGQQREKSARPKRLRPPDRDGALGGDGGLGVGAGVGAHKLERAVHGAQAHAHGRRVVLQLFHQRGHTARGAGAAGQEQGEGQE